MMNIGAVTSTITAAEVLSLAEAGVIDLDAPASTYLTHPLLHRNPTVRQLISHTGGNPEYIQTQALSDAMIADPTRSWTPKEALAYATGRLTDPGPEAQNYSNSNYLLLGMLIENVTGLDYADAVHRDVLAGGDSRFAIQDAEAPTPPHGRAGTHQHRQPLPAQPGDRHHLRRRRHRRRRARARIVGLPALRRPGTGTCHHLVTSAGCSSCTSPNATSGQERLASSRY